ncbi:MAG: tRNA (adenosine(37)-N6)-threonylcarbamoyltransferase complex ATPase subunit type 1 TsaE [Nonlabens sp.]|uniref:tRNA (adenosine(37)-N6)-threonylcarbamoyltransferase complex ATPase subunit type 1 TsaE n=1 Tax=Nonlabens sp. TaxID=1888209 RepID=UPI00321C065A
MEKSYTLKDVDAVAQLLIERFESKVILFEAPMGAGKTTLIKSICKHLGVEEEITSPTFSLVNEYKGSFIDIMHFDLYRLENEHQLYDIGFEEYVDRASYVFIEWPDIAIPFLSNFQTIKIEITDEYRRFIKLIDVS